jgi:parallel beta-helix repeat protein
MDRIQEKIIFRICGMEDFMKGTLGLILFLSCFSIAFAGANTYYVAPPPNGDDSNPGTSADPFATIQHAINVSIAGDSIIVTPGIYQGARFYFKSGTPAMPITLTGQPGAIVNSPGPQNSNGDNLWVRNSSYIIVEGFEIHSAPRSGIAVQADPEPDESFGVIVRNNHCHNNGVWGIFTGYAKNILIEGNETSFSGDEHGIYVSNSSDNPIIRFNISHDNNASGIQINADPVLDGDGIITNAIIDSNVIYNNGVGGGAAINLASVRDSLIVNNLLYNNRATGIAGWDDGYCDDNPGGCGGQYIFGTRDNRIYNNTIVMPSNGRWAISLLNGSINNEIKNNILQNFHAFRGSINLDAESEPGLDSDYNIVKNAFTNNDGDTIITLAAWQALGHDPNSFIPTANLYVDQANGDYHLVTGSEAIDQGTNLSVSDDLDGIVRPQGGTFDIGAYEYVQACPGDQTDPTVSITNPDGTTPVNGTIPFSATANDNCAVAMVEFFVDGSSVGNDSSSPYGINWNTTSVSNGTHNLTAVAHDTSGNTQTSSIIVVDVNNVSIFFDDFEDGNYDGWTFTKGNWTVVAGDLTGSHTRKADIISPDYGGCTNCTVEAYIRILTGRRVSLLVWYTNNKNLVEIGLYRDKGKVILKQKSGGSIVAKKSSAQSLQIGVNYLVSTSFDGTNFSVSLDGTLLFTVPAGAVPAGRVAFRVKNSSGAFREIVVF